MNDIDQPRTPMHLHALAAVETRLDFGAGEGSPSHTQDSGSNQKPDLGGLSETASPWVSKNC